MHDNCRFCLNTIAILILINHAALAEMNRTLHHYLPHCLHLEDFDVQRHARPHTPHFLESPHTSPVLQRCMCCHNLPLYRKDSQGHAPEEEISVGPMLQGGSVTVTVTKTCLWDMADKHCEFGQH